MKVVLASFGSRGDVHPMLALAGGLRQAGHEPLVCAPPDFSALAGRLSIPFEAMGRNIQALLGGAARDLSAPRRALRVLLSEMRAEVDLQFDGLLGAAKGADLVVGTAATMAGRSVAQHMGIPYRYAALCPQLFPSRFHPPPAVSWQSAPAALNRVFWKLSDMMWNRVVLDGVNSRRRTLGLESIGHFWEHAMSDRPILAADPELAPLPSDLAGRVTQTGAWLLPDDTGLDPVVEKFLDGEPRPVYIGFGSMTDPHPGRSTKLILDAVRASGARALISRGWAGLGGLPAPENILIVDEVPHSRLFPRLALVIHHGGAGTVATAARAGVPQLVVPHLLDQHYWAARVRALGLGPRPISRSRLTPDRLAAAIREAAADPGFRDRARDLADRLSARRGVAEAVRAIERGS